MSKSVAFSAAADQTQIVELKDPLVAAALAWLVPGLGHIYQGRTAKGVLFSVCILSTFFYGLFLSNGRAVYASWKPNERNLPFLCQVNVGLPALPALLQATLVRNGKEPLMGGLMAPPASKAELNEWYKTLHHYFELGMVYTMIAGLLNILVVYDALAGPVGIDPREEKPRDESPPSTATT